MSAQVPASWTQQDEASRQRQEELDKELLRFIDYGILLDQRTRRYLAELVRHRILGEPGPQLPPLLSDADPDSGRLNPSYARYLASAVDELFTEDSLLEVFQRQSNLGMQVATETLRWLRTTFQELDRHDPHAEERSRLEFLASLPLEHFLRSYPHQLRQLEGIYPAHQLDLDFYQEAFREALGSSSPAELSVAQAERLEFLLHDLLAAWDALLSAKLLQTQLQALSDAREEFSSEIQRRIGEYQRIQSLFSPFVDYLDRGWDLSRGLWEQADLDLVAEYAALLEHEDAIRELAELLGRMRDAEIQTEELELSREIVTQRWVQDPMLPEEITGVRESGELRHLLSSELALAAEPELEDRFLQKLVDRRLLTFSLSSQRRVTDPRRVTEIQSRSRRRMRGPFILCVDTSFSMNGRPELLAKLLSFGILRVAIEEDREAYLINFSVQIQTLDLRDVGRSVDALADFLRMSFLGGTDITLALAEALRKLEEGRYADADLLIVSDFIMLRFPQTMLETIRRQQHKHGTRFHALTFQDLPESELLSLFDTAWSADPERPGVIEEISEQLQGLRREGA